MPEQVESPGYVPIPEDKIVDGLFDSAKDAFGFLTGRLTKARRSLALKQPGIEAGRSAHSGHCSRGQRHQSR
jgi:hypothetical protein